MDFQLYSFLGVKNRVYQQGPHRKERGKGDIIRRGARRVLLGMKVKKNRSPDTKSKRGGRKKLRQAGELLGMKEEKNSPVKSRKHKTHLTRVSIFSLKICAIIKEQRWRKKGR